MNKTPRISVIIPTYNHSNYVVETLMSVFAQSFNDFEIIVVNDGSTDNTVEVLKPFIEKGLIQYYEQENKGQASARNFGLSCAGGEYITFLDDDDILPINKLETQLNRIQGTSIAAIGGVSGRIIKGKMQFPSCENEEKTFKFEDIFDGSPFCSPGQVLISSKHLRAVNGFDPEIWGADDLDLWMRLIKQGDIVKTSEIALWYRVHSGNSSLQTMRMLKNIKKVIIKNSKTYQNKFKEKLRRKGYRFLFYYSGVEIVLEIKRSIRHFQIFSLLKYTNILFFYFFIPATKDAVLAKNIVLFLCPKRFLEILKDSKQFIVKSMSL
jgi:teichuronic acid biosynthesis glycosyltransferase TuaG